MRGSVPFPMKGATRVWSYAAWNVGADVLVSGGHVALQLYVIAGLLNENGAMSGRPANDVINRAVAWEGAADVDSAMRVAGAWIVTSACVRMPSAPSNCASCSVAIVAPGVASVSTRKKLFMVVIVI